jgi:hypothetical protein
LERKIIVLGWKASAHEFSTDKHGTVDDIILHTTKKESYKSLIIIDQDSFDKGAVRRRNFDRLSGVWYAQPKIREG